MLATPTRQILRPAELLPVIGYIRVSAWFEEKISDEIQKASIEEATRRRGRVVVRWIIDLDATGRNFKRKIMEGIGAVESGDAEGAREIWVWKFSRFGRNRHGVAVNLARIEAAGGQLISATEDVDATTATGGLTRDMLFAIATFESNRIGEQWRETHEYRRVHGLPATGGPRFGYVWTPREIVDGVLRNPESYEPDPDTIETVRKLYEDYAYNDATMRDLAEYLNDNRIHNPAATTTYGWSRQALIYYLDCGFPAGLLHVHRSDVTCAQRSRCAQVGEHYGYIPGSQPPILSDEVWAAFRGRREQRKRLSPRSRIPKYPFSGLVKCGLCLGNAVAASGSRGRRGYVYRCAQHFCTPERSTCPGSTVLSSAVETEVKRWLERAAAEVDRRLQGAVVVPRQPRRNDDARRRERLSAELAKIQKGLDKASAAYAMDDMPRDSYLRIRDDLTAKRDKIDAELGQLQQAEVPASAEQWGVRGAVVGRLLDEWETLSVTGKRDLLMSAVKEIRIFPPDSDERVACVPQDGFVF